jgi:NADP-dependent 3-hydroxy acid dehydrogenase YdfG
MTNDPKTWFLTGASRGLGRIWAEAILERGDRVAATSRDAGRLAPLVERYGDRVLPLGLDVADAAAAREAILVAERHFGTLDVLVNNAGHMLVGALEEATEAQIRDQFDTNLFGALWTTRAALPGMRKRGHGRIIQVSSIGGLLAYPALGIYQASKWALEAASEALAAEVAPHGIQVTLVEPVMFPTGLAASSPQTVPDLTYDAARQALYAASAASGLTAGDPEATAAALLEVADTPDPPVRVIYGAGGVDAVRREYANRLEDLERWGGLSVSAQGRPKEADMP